MQQYEVTANVNGSVIYRSIAKENNLAEEMAGAAKMVEKAIKEDNKSPISIDAKPI